MVLAVLVCVNLRALGNVLVPGFQLPKGRPMKKSLAVLGIVTALGVGLAAPAAADPSGHTGPPNQDCADFSASTRPGHTASSPGAPFNEAGINSANGGIGGQNYSESSQYDVACFQWNAHHS